MSLSVTINGRARIIKFYDLSRLEVEGFDLGAFDLAQREDINRIFELAQEFIESGEAEVYDKPAFEFHGLDPDECTIRVANGEELELIPDEVTLTTVSPRAILSKIERFEPGTLFFAHQLIGDATWEFDSNVEAEKIDPEKFELKIFDCFGDIDQHEGMSSGVYDILCDTILTDDMRYASKRFELLSFVFHKMQIRGQLYIVRLSRDSRIKVLEKVDIGGAVVADQEWQETLDLESFE